MADETTSGSPYDMGIIYFSPLTAPRELSTFWASKDRRREVATKYKIRITRRNGVRAMVPDCQFDSRESAERYSDKYVPTFQRPEIVTVECGRE